MWEAVVNAYNVMRSQAPKIGRKARLNQKRTDALPHCVDESFGKPILMLLMSVGQFVANIVVEQHGFNCFVYVLACAIRSKDVRPASCLAASFVQDVHEV